MIGVVIEPASEALFDQLGPLVAESEQEGWRFVRRLADEWASGANRFDRPGETLLVARVGQTIVGVCGLNVDPYTTEPSVARVRRLYVSSPYRGQGVGRSLVQAVMSAAAGRFRWLRVRTENPGAGRLYERLGFQSIQGDHDCTHRLELANA